MKHTLVQSQQSNPFPIIAVFSKHAVDHPFISQMSAQDKKYLQEVLKGFKAGWLECEKVSLPSHPSSRVLLLGLGEKNAWNRRRLILAARKVIGCVKQNKQSVCSVSLSDFALSGSTLAECAEIFSQNAELAQYTYRAYVQKPKDGWNDVEEIRYHVRGVSGGSSLQKALDRGAIIGEQINAARELANTPGGDMTPKIVARYAREQGEKHGLKVTVFGEKEMKKLGMGAILGVSRGSVEEAQFIVMEYMGSSAKKKPIVFVGKGITYDSGGLNLKPTGGLEEMHMDMSGGAAVIAALVAVARLGVRANVVGIIPAVENMPSGSSYRPGDILRSMSGKTIEITNTDAEGRVVLADALT